MKALTLWQPWASLIAWGEKQYETRSWWTPYRGLLAIHAGKQSDTEELLECNSFYREAFVRNGVTPFASDLPARGVLCIVKLVDVVKTETLLGKISQKEENFGDYSDGRYAWKLELVEVFKDPIRANGKQGLWDWERVMEDSK